MTSQQLQAFLSSPFGMFIIMLMASFVNGMKQLAVTKQTSNAMPWWQYWTYIPETLTVVIGNALAFLILFQTGQLNFASAIAVGYGANSLADLIPRGRSYALKQAPDDLTKMTK